MIGYKPYLFDAFYRWCAQAGQTPVLEFDPVGCILPACFCVKKEKENENDKNLSPDVIPFKKNMNSNTSALNQETIENQNLRFVLSNRFCRNLRMDQGGVRFWIIPKGESEPFDVFIPVESWLFIEAKESGRLQPLDFEENYLVKNDKIVQKPKLRLILNETDFK